MALVINNPTSLGTNAVSASGQASIGRLYAASGNIGDLVIVNFGFGLGSTPSSTSCTDDAGNTFTLAVQDDKLTNNTPHAWQFFCVLTHAITTSNTLTATPNVTVNFPWLAIDICTVSGGTWNASPLDKTAHANGASTSPSSGATGTTSQAIELAFGCIGCGPSETVTWGGGYTGIDHAANSTKSGDTGYLILSSTGAQTASGTIVSADWNCLVATYMATASAPPSVAGLGSDDPSYLHTIY